MVIFLDVVVRRRAISNSGLLSNAIQEHAGDINHAVNAYFNDGAGIAVRGRPISGVHSPRESPTGRACSLRTPDLRMRNIEKRLRDDSHTPSLGHDKCRLGRRAAPRFKVTTRVSTRS